MSYIDPSMSGEVISHDPVELVDWAENSARLAPHESQFISDMRDRVDQYGSDTLLSERQERWLLVLARRGGYRG